MSAPPPTLVTVKVVDPCWLIWDPQRGHWTLHQSPDAFADARPVRAGTWLTLVWPEPR